MKVLVVSMVIITVMLVVTMVIMMMAMVAMMVVRMKITKTMHVMNMNTHTHKNSAGDVDHPCDEYLVNDRGI